jgi:hypothetical protein
MEHAAGMLPCKKNQKYQRKRKKHKPQQAFCLEPTSLATSHYEIIEIHRLKFSDEE